jgi:hypothetical protein
LKYYEPGSMSLKKNLSDKCPHGHPKTRENTYVHVTTGVKSCRICRRLGKKAIDEREKQLDQRARERIAMEKK